MQSRSSEVNVNLVGAEDPETLRVRFLQEPLTTVQRRLIEVVCLYGGLCLEEVVNQLANRWEAGCWIKQHIMLAGDWPYFDG